MSPRAAKPVPQKLMDARMIGQELGLPPNVARGVFRLVAREDGIVRFPGYRRIFVRREDVERLVQSSGAMRWV